MSHQCKHCSAQYVWRHDLTRHVRNKHSDSTSNAECLREPKPMPRQHQSFQSQQTSELRQMPRPSTSFRFLHPFTLVTSGPTACGKSYFVTRMLQERVISPLPQRIIWLYKRWQPLYDVIKETVTPSVEFVQGIPPGLESDQFLD
ncbi:hypothetical protein, partial [Solemya elarraichensis gill symbiont]|uniref:hypothetical protein n=1 Tax=Solemya elarraichensis gill symbiont TaxID=1918949 RepID=UPI00108447C6